MNVSASGYDAWLQRPLSKRAQEEVLHRRYRSRQETIKEITEYIEIFYNRPGRQARLGFLSPAAYEQRFYAGQQAT